MVDWNALPDAMLMNFVRRYERAGVQRAPRLRFVDAEGRACLAAALCGAASARDVHERAARLGHPFRGGILERISRHFETNRLTADEMYDGCVLELTRRRVAATLPHRTSASVAVEAGAPHAPAPAVPLLSWTTGARSPGTDQEPSRGR